VLVTGSSSVDYRTVFWAGWSGGAPRTIGEQVRVTPRSDDNTADPHEAPVVENEALTGDAAHTEHPAGESHAESNSENEPVA
jgi:hypothetical protein